MEAAEYLVDPHSLHSKHWYTSYRQTSVFFQAAGCHIVSGDPIQGQHIPDGDALRKCTVAKGRFICRSVKSEIYKSKNFPGFGIQMPSMCFDHDISDNIRRPMYT